jgi:hypothetical protein
LKAKNYIEHKQLWQLVLLIDWIKKLDESIIARPHNTGLASLIFNWQKWWFSAPQISRG